MSFRTFNPGIRTRLWLALALLATSTMFVGAIAWFALDRANTRLQELHQSTLTEVARSLQLSKQSSDIATSAPYLLNLGSAYLIQREGQILVDTLEPATQDWPSDNALSPFAENSFEHDIAVVVRKMRGAIADMIVSAKKLNLERDKTIALNARLTRFASQMYLNSIEPESSIEERRTWLALQAMANELVGAGNADNLLGVGEHRRKFQIMTKGFELPMATSAQAQQFTELAKFVTGQRNLFEVRRAELSRVLESQNALFRIRLNANTISDLAVQFAKNAETSLSNQREETTTLIGFAKAAIIMAGLGSVTVALISAYYVSGYVTANIRAISDAMLRLAQGDRNAHLRRKSTKNDEIGKLLQSFRVFRANALRLDRSNRQLNQKNTLFEKVFANITDGVAITNDAGQLTATNPTFGKVLHLGPDGAPTKSTISELLALTTFAEQSNQAGLDSNFYGTTELQNESGHFLEIRCNRLPDGGAVWQFSDTTERRQMDERLRQIQHIESLGKVTGEVAHDFGNILSTVSSNVHLLVSGSKRESRKTLLQRIGNAVDIGTSLTQRLLAFARQQALQPEVVDLNGLIAGLADLIEIGLKSDVRLETIISEKNLPVLVDPGQLESAVLNLCLNASQAIIGKGVIQLTVTEGANNSATVTVSDTGQGMDETILARSLEPFFTARSDGEGTGLGLSMVYGFIKQTGGDIQIDSKVGTGTDVCLTFPLHQKQTTPVATVGQNNNLVLVVEDDPKSLSNISDLLGKAGYHVSEANSFEAAEEALKSDSVFSAMVTDLHLNQGKLGWALAETCLQNRQGMKVVVTSGRLPAQNPFADQPNANVICLAKPLSAEKLSNVLADAAE